MAKEKKNALVVGCGFAGAVSGRRLAENGWNVAILDKRPHIGGNAYEEYDANGIRVHKYGPHIFHTDDREAYAFLSRFTEWYPYEHRVLGRIDGKLVPIPFNFTSLESLFPAREAAVIQEKLLAAYPGLGAISVLDLQSSEDADVRAFGDFVFEKVFIHYTAKQWGIPVAQVDRSVINRVPVAFGRDDRYFHDAFQCMPAHGFTKLFEKMLDHPDITLHLGCDAKDWLQPDPGAGLLRFSGSVSPDAVLYTGPLDELFGRVFGSLPYRSLNMVFEALGCPQFQPAAVVNYPNEEDFTRITEFKHLTRQEIPHTTILREYPLPYDPDAEKAAVPYYPIQSGENQALYMKYRALADRIPGLYLCGRLAEYKYYNMDAATKAALEAADLIMG